jgi:hypothetical protein
MTLESHLQKWWKRLSDDQRAQIQKDAADDRMEPSTMELLKTTECPIGPVGTQWQSEPYSWDWLESVRKFIVAQ